MAIATRDVTVTRQPPTGLAEVVDLILDKGLVIDAYIRVSIIGIELLVIDARIVVASVDTYLRFAEAVNRLDLTQTKDAATLRDLRSGGAEDKAKGVMEGGKKEVKEAGEKLRPSRKRKREREKQEEGNEREAANRESD
jgi:gas vesicle structural protein